MTYTQAMSQQAYQQNQFQTASPGELTLMLYNGCLKFLRLAKRGLEAENYEEKNKNITKAQNIIRELMVTLQVNDETSEQMLKLYDYVHDQLIQANVHNRKENLDNAEAIVTEFRDTWKQVIQVDRQNRHQGGNCLYEQLKCFA